MSALLMTLALAATNPDAAAPKTSPAPAAAMKDCCATMKAEGKDCCCCKDMAAGHGEHAKHGEPTAKSPGEHSHAH